MHDSLSSGSNGSTSSHVLVPTVGPAAPRPPHKMHLLGLKNKVTRHNHPLSLHSLTDMVRSNCSSGGSGKKGSVVHVLVCVEEDYPLAPVAMAIARAFPLFSMKTKSGSKKIPKTLKAQDKDTGDDADDDNDGSHSAEVGIDMDGKAANDEIVADDDDDTNGKVVHVTFLDNNHKIIKNTQQIQAAQYAADGVRLACRLVDTPPEELTTTAYSHEVATLFEKEETVTMEEIIGEELKERGYGGIYNVGKGATEPPRLIMLTYQPPKEVLSEEINENNNSNASITLIGKGIVYDTGGLAIKARAGMCGMKHDMGGSAGVLGGFWAAVQLRTPRKLRLLLCLVRAGF
jgi:leucyl aminopeptidase